jgi:hypothetical protein
MKKAAVLLTCFLVLVLAAACQKDNAALLNDEMPEEEDLWEGEAPEELQVQITVALGRGAYSVESKSYPILERIRSYQEAHQDVGVKSHELMYMSGVPFQIDPFPDVIELAPHQARWVADGELETLDSVVQMIGWSGAYADLIERTKVNNHVRMLPINAEPLVVYYDEEVFGRLNLSLPHDDWTWDEFISASVLLDANGYSVSIPDSFEIYEPIIKGLGGGYISQDGSTFTGFLDGEATVRAFEQVIASFGEQRANAINRNRPIALGIDWPSALFSQLDENEHLKIARMPVFPDGNRYNTMFTTGLSISSQSKFKSTALELVKSVIEADDREAVRFANYHALVTREGRFQSRPPAQTGQLLDIMELETQIATPNPFQLHTNIIFYQGLLYNHEDVFFKSFPQIYEQGTAEPVLKQLAGILDTLYPSMKGNWRGL